MNHLQIFFQLDAKFDGREPEKLQKLKCSETRLDMAENACGKVPPRSMSRTEKYSF
jgi:hypothetical protein